MVVINVHLSEDIGRQETKLAELKRLEDNLSGLILSALKEKETKIVIGGDFNYNFTPPVKIEIFGLIFAKEEPSINTCCDLLADGTIPLTNKYDHLLFSENVTLINFRNIIKSEFYLFRKMVHYFLKQVLKTVKTSLKQWRL